MGWGMSMGIGWPNASASAGPPVVMGYFEIASLCSGILVPGTTSQLVDTSLYSPGDYVAYNTEIGYLAGLQLGNIVSAPSDEVLIISGPVYTGCPVNFAIDLVCPDLTPELMATVLIAPGLYNTGDYVFSPDTAQTVLLGNIISDLEAYQLITISKPVYQACQVSYNVYDCIQEESYITGYYNAGTFGSGDRVYTQSGNYGYVNNPVEYQEGDIDTEAFPIGFVDYTCNDCNVNLSATITKEDVGVFYINLFGHETLGDQPFQSSINTLYASVNYTVQLSDGEGDFLNISGSYNFEINSYNIPAGHIVQLASNFAFNAGEIYGIDEQNVQITSINFDGIALGPYDTGWDSPNKYVTNYGNVWTMYY